MLPRAYLACVAIALLPALTTSLRPPWRSHSACGGQAQPAAAVASVIKDGDVYRVVADARPGAVAQGAYLDSAHTPSNFGKLRITTSSQFSDQEQMYAAGMLEGHLTSARIEDHHHNIRSYFRQQLNASLERPMEWIHQQDTWVRQQVEDHPSCPYWTSVGLVLAQYDGMVDGYLAAAQQAVQRTAGGGRVPLTREDLLFLHSNADLYDIMDMYDAQDAERSGRSKWEGMDPDQLYMALGLQGKCSALVKVTADLSDLLFGHSTFDSYTAMTRIFKHYEFALHHPKVAAQSLSFSSYPGELFSDDDLYMSSAGLVVLETTNHIFNSSIWKALTPHSVLSWQRVRVSNLLAASGEDWVGLYRRHNSGTYNNQYMVVDLKRFKPRQGLRPGLLWVVEQVPGLVVARDMTEVLARGYWPSYNVAFFPEISEAAGYPSFAAKQRARGVEYDAPTKWLMYQVSPRANIFRRSHSNVTDLAGMMHLMRYNDYRHDPLSGGHPVAAVCARGDLAAKGAIPKGCYDTKVTSYKLAQQLTAVVVGGPTAQEQPPFHWEPHFREYAHQGMPNRFDFQFERQSAADLPYSTGCTSDKSQAQA